MDVRVLLETGLSGKCFTALGTRMTTGANVTSANVPLQIRRIGEYLWGNGKGNIMLNYIIIGNCYLSIYHVPIMCVCENGIDCGASF